LAVGNRDPMKKQPSAPDTNGKLGIEDTLLDDDELLPDKILRLSHRSPDGHVANTRLDHDTDPRDNMLVLYVYTRDDEGCTMHRHYVYSPSIVAFNSWRDLAIIESKEVSKVEGVIGVYGWCTTFINFTPLREDDLLTLVTKEKYTYVRLTFSTRTHNGKTRTTGKAKQTERNNRSRHG